MKLFHLSDLHFGKLLHGVSLLEQGDQPHWVEALLSLAREHRPDAVLIAGDVYDRQSPSGAAMGLFSHMVTELSELGIHVLVAAGNHDSGERLSCFHALLERQNVYLSGLPQRELRRVTLTDEYGPVTLWLLPYTFPAAAARVLEDESIRDYDTAVRRLLAEQNIDFTRRNVIIAHQNVTKGGVEGIRGGSESMVGGVGQVDCSAFDGFDYAALGHIHAAYAVGREAVRYAGSPLCYHFDEVRQPDKGPLLVELGEKGTEPVIRRLSIPPLHPMRELRGSYEEVLAAAAHAGTGEYVKVVLTDRPLTPEISAHLEALFRTRGSLLMERVSSFRRFTGETRQSGRNERERRSVEELFAEFYTQRANGAPEEEDLSLLHCAAELLRHSEAGEDGRAVPPELSEQLLRYLTEEAEA